jgi:hypothetical protein
MRLLGRSDYHDQSCWWFPGCQTVPTAPPGQRQLCTGYTGNYPPICTNQGSIGKYDRLNHVTKQPKALPILVRRWSSVEVGGHQVPLETKYAFKDHGSHIARLKSVDEVLTPLRFGCRLSSSRFNGDTKEYSVIRTVGDKSTLHEIGLPPLEVPARITLRRVSGSAGATTRDSPLLDKKSIDVAERSTQLAVHQKRTPNVYLITNHDIDNITELIETQSKQDYEAQSASTVLNLSHSPSSPRIAPVPGPTKGVTLPTGIIPSNSVPVLLDQPKVGTIHCGLEQFNIIPGYKRKWNGSGKVDSSTTELEVIWQDDATPNSEGYLTDADDSNVSVPFIYSEPGTPGHRRNNWDCNLMTNLPQIRDKGHAFNPASARSSISNWSWSLPRNKISFAVTNSDDEGDPERTPFSGRDGPSPSATPGLSPSRERPKTKPFLRYRVSANKIRDVESFPALPKRKATADWFSPLPEMTTHLPISNPGTLYDVGVDATCGTLSHDEVAPKASPLSRAMADQITGSKSMEFNWNVDTPPDKTDEQLDNDLHALSAQNELQEIRRKSAVKIHPSSPARTGSLSSIGSSIGASHHERRRSARVLSLHTRTLPTKSVPFSDSKKSMVDLGDRPVHEIARVRTIDNIHKGEGHNRCGRWRPPTPCPPARSPSPSECRDAIEDTLSDSESLTGNTRLASQPGVNTLDLVKGGLAKRTSLVREIAEPSLKVDHVGIYGQITGARRKPLNEDRSAGCCPEEGEVHECDDATNYPDGIPSIDWIG